MNKLLKFCSKSSAVSLALISFSTFAVGNSGITYHGRILNPDNTVVIDNNVQFKLQIRTPDAQSCLMYEEIQAKDLSSSNGAFAITINDGTGSRTDSSGVLFDKVFANYGSLSFSPATCSSGAGNWTPNSSDGRTFNVLFKTSAMSSWEPLPPQALNFVPMSIEAKQVAGYPGSSLFRVENGSGPQTVSSLTPAQATALLNLSNGTSTTYVKSTTNGASLPSFATDPSSPSAGQVWYDSTNKTVKYYDGTTIQVVGSGGAVSGSSITSGTIGGTTSMNTSGSVTAASVSSTTDSTNALRLFENTNTHKVTVTVPSSLAADYPLQLPGALPTSANQFLVSDTSGVTSWSPNMTIDSTGKLGLGTTSPAATLHLSAADAGILERIENRSSTGARYPGLEIYNYTGSSGGAAPIINLLVSRGDSTTPAPIQNSDNSGIISFMGRKDTAFGWGSQIIGGATATWSDTSTPGKLTFLTTDTGSTAPAARMTILPSGNVGIGSTNPGSTLTVNGTTTSTTLNATTINLQQAGVNTSSITQRNIILYDYGGVGATNNPTLQLRSARTSGGGPVANNDVLGQIQFQGANNGFNTNTVAKISGEVDGTVTTSALPSRLTFYTTPTGTATAVERVRIDNAGFVGIGTTTPAGNLAIDNTGHNATLCLNGGCVSTLASGGGGGTSTTSQTFNSNSDGTGSDGGYNFQANGTNLLTINNAGDTRVTSTTATSSVSTGALVVDGGMGVGGSLNIGANFSAGGSVRGVNLVQSDGTTNTAYTSTGAVAAPLGTIINARNQSVVDATGAFTTYSVRNAVPLTQNAYVGAISTTGAGVYTPSIVFGQQTGSATYAERMRIDSNGNVGIGTSTAITNLQVYKSTAGNAAIFDGASSTGVRINAPAGNTTFITSSRGNLYRWDVGANATPESGSNAGTDFNINRYDDAGSLIDTSFSIKRSTGYVGIGTNSAATPLVVVANPSGSMATPNGFGTSTVTTATSGTNSLASIQYQANPGSSSTGVYWGLQSQTGTTTGNAQNVTSTIGLAAVAGSINHRGTGTVTGATALYATTPAAPSGTVSNAYGLYLESQAATNVTKSFGVYQNGSADLNYFAGNVGVGLNAPIYPLDVRSFSSTTPARIGQTTGTTSAVETALLVDAGSSGTTAAGFGPGITFTGKSSVSSGRDMGQIVSVWSDPTDASHSADMAFYTANAANAGAASTEKVRIMGNGRVGIGTVSPIGNLAIDNTGHNATLCLNGGCVSTLAPGGGSQTSTSNFVLNSNSDGTGSDGGFDFQANATSIFKISNAGAITTYGNITGNSALAVAAGGTNQNLALSSSGTGSVNLGTGNGTGLSVLDPGVGASNYVTVKGAAAGAGPVIGTAGSDANINLILTPKGTGFVGIGTTNPLWALDVAGGVHSSTRFTGVGLTGVAPSAFAPVISQNTGGATDEKYWDFYHSATALSIRAVDDAYSASTTGLQFNRNGATVSSVIFPNGQVGIGTGTPGSLLDIYQNTNADVTVGSRNAFAGKGAYFRTTANSNFAGYEMVGSGSAFWRAGMNGGTSFSITDANAVTTPLVIEKGASSNSLYVKANGTVGVGTTSPADPVHVVSANTGGTAVRIQNTDTGGKAWAIISTGSTSNGGAGNLSFYNASAGTSHLSVNANGNVGIGTTIPSANLDIRGADADIQSLVRNSDSTIARYPGFYARNYMGSAAAGYPTVKLTNSRGNSGTSAAIQSGDLLGTQEFWGVTDTASTTKQGVQIQATATENWSGSANGSGLIINTVLNGSTTVTPRMVITGSGTIGIGTATPGGNLAIDNTGHNATLCLNGSCVSSLAAGGGGGTSTASQIFNSNSDGTGSDGGFNFQANGSNLITIANNGDTAITSTTASTNGTTGALTVAGGLGVNGAINSNGTISGGAFSSAGNTTTTYTSTSSSLSSPMMTSNEPSINVLNSSNTDGTSAVYGMQAKNTATNIQRAYMGVVSNTGAGVYTPTIVFGQQTGATAYAERMRIDSAGNVGIGTNNPGYLFHVGANTGGSSIAEFQNTGGDTRVKVEASNGNNAAMAFSTAQNIRWTAGKNATSESGSNVGSDFAISRYNDAGTVVDSPFLIQRSTGNVGVGTTNPSALLQVSKNGGASPSSYAMLLEQTSTTGANNNSNAILRIQHSNSVNSRIWDIGTGSTTFGNVDFFGFKDAAQSTPSLVLSSLGGVGIGTTSPSGALHVNYSNTATSGTISGLQITPTYNQASGTAANTDLLINRTQTAVGSGTQNLIDAQVAGSSKFSVSNGGSVSAVGNIGANGMLQSVWPSSTTYSSTGTGGIPGNMGGLVKVANTSATDSSYTVNSFLVTNASSVQQQAFIGAVSNTGAGTYTPSIVIGQQSGSNAYTERMRIDASGNVGIGTATPAGNLAIDNAGHNATLCLNGVCSTTLGGGGGGTQASSTNFVLNSNSDGTGSDGGFDFQSNASSIFKVSNAGAITTYGNITGNSALAVSAGGTNQNLALNSSGTGAVNVGTGNGTGFSVLDPGVGTANYITVKGAAAGSAPVLGTAGSDTNINLVLTPKGTGKVGIGTNTPAARLDLGTYVNGWAGDVLMRIQGSSKAFNIVTLSDDILIANSTDGKDMLRLRPDAGVSIAGADVWKGKLAVADGILVNGGGAFFSLYSNDGNPAYLQAQTSPNSSNAALSGGATLFRIQADGTNGSSGQTGGKLEFVTENAWTNTSNSTNFRLYTSDVTGGPTERIRVTADGKVGIGTTTPVGNLAIDNSAHNATLCLNGVCSSSLGGGGGTGDFKADGSVAMTGNLQLGAHSILGGAAANSYLFIEGSTTSDGNIVMNSNGGTLTVGINGSGNVPFSTWGTPTTYGSVRAIGAFVNTSDAYSTAPQSGLVFQGMLNGFGYSPFSAVQGGKENTTSGDDAGILTFHTKANGGSFQEKMRITSAGYVGIGTTTPAGTLHLKGNDSQLMIESPLSANNEAMLYFKKTGESTIKWSMGRSTYGSVPDDTFRINEDDSNTTSRLVILPGGNVGIGTTAPTSGLHVRGNTNQKSSLFLENVGGGGTDDTSIYMKSTAGYWEINANDSANLFVITDQNAGAWPGNARFSINGTGNVGIGTTNPGYLLDVNGSTANVSGAWVIRSDERLKRDIATIDNALETIIGLRGVSFRWKDPEMDQKYGLQRGFIAQEVEQVVPEWVHTGNDGYKRLEKTGIEAYLVNAIKELYAKFVGQDREIAAIRDDNKAKDLEIQKLKEENAAIKARLENIERALTTK